MDTALLEKLDLQTFEKLCRLFFEQMGFIAKTSGMGAMPGISAVIVLHSKSSNTPFALLQCARFGGQVEPMQMAQVKAAMVQLGLANGYLVAAGSLSPAVRDFAAANKINLIEADKLVELIDNLPEKSRGLLQEVVTPGRFSGGASQDRQGKAGGSNICAKCGTTMKLQVKMQGPHQTGKFWQCPRPGCGYISAYL